MLIGESDKMNKRIAIFYTCLLFVGGLFFSVVAHAQVQPPTMTLTMRQVEDLNDALTLLSRGSMDQCPAKAAAAAPADSKAPAPPDHPCPYRINEPLMRAMAQNIVALKDADAKFKVEQNVVRTEVIADVPIPTGGTDVAIRAVQGQQDIKYLAKMQPVYAETVSVPALAMIKWNDLNTGDPPEHNRISPEIDAVLAPMISDFGVK
jgi:hypothetical protein